MMATLSEWIEEEAGGDEVEAVVIGEMGWGNYGSGSVPGYADHPRNVVLSWNEARPHLTYEFNSGYGAPGCEAITAWTKSRVIFVSQYDGATSICSVPRHPVDHQPEMPGG